MRTNELKTRLSVLVRENEKERQSSRRVCDFDNEEEEGDDSYGDDY